MTLVGQQDETTNNDSYEGLKKACHLERHRKKLAPVVFGKVRYPNFHDTFNEWDIQLLYRAPAAEVAGSIHFALYQGPHVPRYVLSP